MDWGVILVCWLINGCLVVVVAARKVKWKYYG